MSNWRRCDAYLRLADSPVLARCVSEARHLIVMMIFGEAYPIRRCELCAARWRANAAKNGFEVVFDERIEND